MKKLSILILVLLFSKISIAEDLTLIYPVGISCNPTHINVTPAFTIQIRVAFEYSGSSGTSYRYSINVKQGGVETFIKGESFNHEILFDQTLYMGQNNNSNSGSAICLNNTAEIIIRVWNLSGNKDTKIATGSFIPYALNPQGGNLNYCDNNIYSAHNGIPIKMGRISTFTIYNNCGNPATGVYVVDKYKVSFNIPHANNKHCVVINDFCWGWSQANPNNEYPFGQVETNTPNYDILTTYVYEIISNVSAGPISLGYAPCNPSNAVIAYKLVDNPLQVPPIISYISQTPNVLTLGNTCTFECFLSQGNIPGTTYSWQISGIPNGMNITYSVDYNKFYLTWLSFKNKNISSQLFQLKCTASNAYGSNVKYYSINNSSNSGGCPFIWVNNQDSIFQEDNNILHKSEYSENIGQDISDKYILNVNPSIIDNLIYLKLMEIGNDSTLFNQIKFYAIDHPTGTKIGVTEDNQIVSFVDDNVSSSSYALLTSPDNKTIEITDNINYRAGGRLSTVHGDSLYYIFAKYDGYTEYNRMGIIAQLQYIIPSPYPVKQTIAYGLAETSNGNYTFDLSGRSNKSVTVVPVFTEGYTNSLSTLNINWLKDFSVRYIAVADLDYDNFSISECQLNDAIHSKEGIINNLIQGLDNLYSYVTPNEFIELSFLNPTPSANFVRDYMIEINGKIILPGTKSLKKDIKLNKNVNIPKIKDNSIILSKNYPDPFNPSTKINYQIPYAGLVSLKVYDVLGREIRTLVNEFKEAGKFTVEFNGNDLSSGVYFYRLDYNGLSDIKKMILLK